MQNQFPELGPPRTRTAFHPAWPIPIHAADKFIVVFHIFIVTHEFLGNDIQDCQYAPRQRPHYGYQEGKIPNGQGTDAHQIKQIHGEQRRENLLADAR